MSPDYGRDTTLSTLPNALGAVSWGAIFAGAAAAAALSLILLLLGTGLGLSAVSPWAHEGISGTTWSVTTIVWITLTSLIASGLGGYIAGRLRARWVATHSDEVYFRDTAHGFLAWAVATLVTATLLTSVISSVIGGAVQTGAAVAGTAATGGAAAVAASANSANPDEKAEGDKSFTYFLDYLFRKNTPAVAPTDAATPPPATAAVGSSDPKAKGEAQAEIARIFVNAISTGKLPPADVTYAGQLLAPQVGVSQQDAEKRITTTFDLIQTKLREAETAAKAAADKARKATSYGSLWLFISLLIGAFVASLAAIYGGRQRDL
ncbi:MAG: hypothetical protein EOO53_09065 [Gammaproteobacteria bacterium]|nr:MAG: hypothetical protein EOO53_09065 [Gammaproteobacteria bacterium]